MSPLAKRIALLLLALAVTASPSIAQVSGIYGLAVELLGTGTGATNNGRLTLYGLNPAISGTDPRYLPTGSVATQSGAWTSESNDSSVTFNLGTFYPDAGDTLTLTGGSELTYQDDGATVNPNDASLHYSVVPSGSPDYFLPGINLPVDSTNPSGNGNGDIRFATEAERFNLLDGLDPGTYTLSVYGFSYASTGDNVDNNNSLYYSAAFTVIPEPGLWAMLVAGFGVLIGFQPRRILGN